MTNKKRQSGLTMIEVLIASIILTALVGMASWLVWSSSNHVSTEESKLQVESQAREVMNAITSDLRASKVSMIQGFLPNYTGTYYNGTGTWESLVDGHVYVGIDITMPNNKQDVVTSGGGTAQGIDLTKFNSNQYWNKRSIYSWIVDPGQTNILADQEKCNGVDDNKNGLIDEGMIQKKEWVPNWNTGVAPVNSTNSIITRNVHNVNILTSKYVGLKFVASAPTVGGIVNRIDITLTLQKIDSKYNNSKMNLGTTDADKDVSQSIIKTVTDTAIFRNN